MSIKVITITALVLVTAPAIVRFLIQRFLLQKMALDLKMKWYDQFFDLMDRPICKMTVPIFSREYAVMQAYSIMGKDTLLNHQFEVLLNLPLTPRQESEISRRAFSFYTQKGAVKQAQDMLERVKRSADATVIHECEVMYSVYVLKESRFIDELQQKLSDSDTLENAAYHYMLALQYSYLGDEVKKKEHLDATRHLIEDKKRQSYPPVP